MITSSAGTLVPEYMKFGRIVRVIPHPDLPEHLTEYEVDFKFVVTTFYQSQLPLSDRSAAIEDPPSR